MKIVALFKILKGKKANLPNTYHEGYCYLTTDEGNLYIDTTDTAVGRIPLNGILYGICNTEANIAAKVVNTASGFPKVLYTGLAIIIRFGKGSNVANPTLNLNGTGAKGMRRYAGTSMSTGTTTAGLIAGAMKLFVYDGSSWIEDYWYNTTYSAGNGISIDANNKISINLGGGSGSGTAESVIAKASTSAYGVVKIGTGLSVNDGVVSVNADSVSFSRSLTSGTKIGTITINGTATDLYCQTNTDTHYTTRLYVGASGTATNAATSNGSTYIKLYDNTTSRASFKITGTGGTTVSSDSGGNITINSSSPSLGDLMGSSAKGSEDIPVYWTGSAFAPITRYEGYCREAGYSEVLKVFETDQDRIDQMTAIFQAFGGDVPQAYGSVSYGGVLTWLFDEERILQDQPERWGYLLTLSGAGNGADVRNGPETSQLFFGAPKNGLYRRGGNASGWSTNNGGIWSHILEAPISCATGQMPVAAEADAITMRWVNGLTYTEVNDITAVVNQSTSYLPLTGGTLSGDLTIGRSNENQNLRVYGNITGDRVYGAVWNDYAEYRAGEQNYIKPGLCVVETGNNDEVCLSAGRLQSCGYIVSDTFGFSIGKTTRNNTPVAVSGRVLAYTELPPDQYKIGDVMCTGPDGKLSKMTFDEIVMYPDKIIGIICGIPEYTQWNNILVNNRVWVKIY